jgi:hypothetical protein
MTPEAFLERAILMAPVDPPLRDAWRIVLGALERARISSDDLRDVLSSLHQGRDLIVEEVGFEHIAGELRVSFLDEDARCSAADMIAQLDKLFRPEQEA